MVFGVCRRVTGDYHLAEDAFQAVFVVLVAKAGSVRPSSALPAWLHRVAYWTAMRARTMNDRRRRREAPVEILPESAIPSVDSVEVTDLIAALDEEIARLPEHHRTSIVAFELEGRSRQDAAAQLGISEGTLSSRLARARSSLADRLRRRGIVLSVAGLTSVLGQPASGNIPGGLFAKVMAGVVRPGLIPASVAFISHGVLRVMFIQKLKDLPPALGVFVFAVSAVGLLLAADPSAGRDLTGRATLPILNVRAEGSHTAVSTRSDEPIETAEKAFR